MSNRLSKIYTRTGDKGTTGLGDGSRVDKDHVKIESIGTIDELNSVVGIILTESIQDRLKDLFSGIQHRLFDLGAELSLPTGNDRLQAVDVDQLEQALDHYNESLPPLKEFILPGGTPAAALCHLARTVCRRAERNMVTLNKLQPVSAISLAYINRLSDLFFVLARWLNKQDDQPDILWKPAKKPED